MQTNEEGQSSKTRFIIPDSVYKHKHNIRFITPSGQNNKKKVVGIIPHSLNAKIQNFSRDIQRVRNKMSRNKDSKPDPEGSNTNEERRESRSPGAPGHPKSADCLPFAPRVLSSYPSAGRETVRSSEATGFKFAKPNVQPRLFFVAPNRAPAPTSNSYSDLGPSGKSPHRETGSQQNNFRPRNMDLSQWTNSSKQVSPSVIDNRPKTDIGTMHNMYNEMYNRVPFDQDRGRSPRADSMSPDNVNISSRSHRNGDKVVQDTRKSVLVHNAAGAYEGPSYVPESDGRKRHYEHFRVDRSRQSVPEMPVPNSASTSFQSRNSLFSYDAAKYYVPSIKVPHFDNHSPDPAIKKVRLIGKKDLKAIADPTGMECAAAQDPVVKRETDFQKNTSPRLIGNWPSANRAHFPPRDTEREKLYLQSKMSGNQSQLSSRSSTGFNKDMYAATYLQDPKLANDLVKSPGPIVRYDDYAGSRDTSPGASVKYSLEMDRGSLYAHRPEYVVDRSGRHVMVTNARELGMSDRRTYNDSNASRTSRGLFAGNYSPSAFVEKSDDVNCKRSVTDSMNEIRTGHPRDESGEPETIDSHYNVAEPGSTNSKNQKSQSYIGSSRQSSDGFSMQSPATMQHYSSAKGQPDTVTKSHVVVSYYYPKHQTLLRKGDSSTFYEGVEYQICNKFFQVEKPRPIVEKTDSPQRSSSAKHLAERVASLQATGYEMKQGTLVSRPSTADSTPGSKTALMSRPSVISEPMFIASPSSGSLETEREIDETDSALSVSDSEDDGYRPAQQNSSAVPVKDWTEKKTTGPRLYRFLLELLDQPDLYPCVQWVNKEERMFKFLDSNHVAKLWGKRKNRPHMKYENFARSLRCYKFRGILRKPRQKLVYQFGEGW